MPDGGGNRRLRFSSAAGSANEVSMALRIAAALGTIQLRSADHALSLYDRIRGMLWPLTRR